MGRTLALLGGLAIATSAWTATGALEPRFRVAHDPSADLRLARAGGTWSAGPVLELPGPTLRGRGRAPTRTTARAREYGRQVLLVDPQNPDARQLIHVSLDAERRNDEAEARNLFDGRWKAVIADLETQPSVVTVDFPEEWLDGITARVPVGEEEIPEDDANVAAILTILHTKRIKGLGWDAANLDQVVQYLRTITGLDFFITPKVRAEAYDEIEITLDLDDVTVRTVLDVVTQPWNLSWTAENGLVRIATWDERPDELFIRYFDLTDLDPVGERSASGVDPLSATAPPSEPSEVEQARARRDELCLAALVEDTLGGESAWEEPAVLEIRSRILIARNTAPVLDRVGALLDEIRANGGLRKHVERHHWGTVSGAPPRSLDRGPR